MKLPTPPPAGILPIAKKQERIHGPDHDPQGHLLAEDHTTRIMTTVTEENITTIFMIDIAKENTVTITADIKTFGFTLIPHRGVLHNYS